MIVQTEISVTCGCHLSKMKRFKVVTPRVQIPDGTLLDYLMVQGVTLRAKLKSAADLF